MPDILLDSNEDSRQYPDQQLNVLLNGLALRAVRIYLNLRQEFHSFFSGWRQNLKSSEVTEVVFQDE